MTPNTVRRRRARARRGFTLVEMVFAILMLSIGLLSLAGLSLTASRMTTGGGRQMAAASVAAARFDSLASLPCASLAASGTQSGTTPTVRGIRESWAVTSGTNVKNLVDTLWVTGRTKPLVYLNEIPCR
jgi:prepilin-type N-terminal cleavage/methylation domain-containing protein